MEREAVSFAVWMAGFWVFLGLWFVASSIDALAKAIREQRNGEK